MSKLLGPLFELESMHADMEWIILQEIERLGDVCKAVMYSQAHWALLSLFESADGIRQQLSQTAVDDSLAIGIEERWGEVRRPCVLKL